jgi:hypothetical protein
MLPRQDLWLERRCVELAISNDSTAEVELDGLLERYGPDSALRYGDLLDRWAGAIGKDRLYVRAEHEGSNLAAILNQVLSTSIMGLPKQLSDDRGVTTITPWTVAALSLMRLLDARQLESMHRETLMQLAREIGWRSALGGRIFSREQVETILGLYRESNDYVAAKYGDAPDGGEFFGEPWLRDSSEWEGASDSQSFADSFLEPLFAELARRLLDAELEVSQNLTAVSTTSAKARQPD